MFSFIIFYFFQVEEDTENYMQYKIMTLQENQKTTLRLKKGIIPHKFQCQKDTELQSPPERKGSLKRKHQEIIEDALSVPPAKQTVSAVKMSESSKHSYIEEGASMPSSHLHAEYTETVNFDEPCCSTSLADVNKKVIYVDKAIQVNRKKHYYRSKAVNVNLSAITKNTAISPFRILSKTTSTSPLKIAQTSGIKRKLFQTDPADIASVSSAQPSSALSSSFEPEMSSESSWSIDDDSENETQFKSQMRSCTLLAIEKEPKMLLGVPKKSYYIIKLLSENLPLPTVDILITLKKIKLNESFSILALQFGYTQSAISRIFSKCLPLLAMKMKELIIWPTTKEIFKNLPIAFRARYSNVVSIIDCLEIQIEKPSNAVHQSLSWSQYKKCNTLKYLISCTPDGLVNFISVGYSGRATDVMIVEDCGFLDCLPPKTAVMADRGFKEISHLLEKKQCTLIRPPSVFKSTASAKEDVKQSKRIAALRIHIERVINRLREFHMLLPHACVDHSLIPIIDEVIIIACGLINIQDVLIKK